jgi:translation initiation factor 1A
MNNEDNQENLRAPLPKKKKNEMFGIADQLLGGSRVNVNCEDGKTRLARIPRARKKRRKLRRIRSGDLLIISPWEIQDEKADILFKYKFHQAKALSRKNLIPAEIDVF